MSEVKTTPNDNNALEFIQSVADDTRRADALVLLDLFARVTGKRPKMWGSNIVGYGMYHYKSERSRQEGDWPLTAFSPRKQSLSLYIIPGFTEYGPLLAKLGKHKTGKSCLYINKLADVDMAVLEELVALGYADSLKQFG